MIDPYQTLHSVALNLGLHCLSTSKDQTDRPWQTVQTQIRLLLEEQSDQGQHCLSLHLHLLANFSMKDLFV